MSLSNPTHDPLDTEMVRVLDENPGLREELMEWDRRISTGEVRDDEFVTTEEVRRRLGMRPRPA